jgi:RNA polymerase sigma-70 factor (sigma-E family)
MQRRDRVGRDEQFTDYVAARMGSLRRLAYLLCQDRGRVDDLVQAAITRLYVHWGRASVVDNLDAYTRTILVRVYLKERQSRWSTMVQLSSEPPDRAALTDDREGALDLRAALSQLPARQRATLVLRFYCDLSVEQAAQLLGCSPGTVKSQTAKGLEAMRRGMGTDNAGDAYPPTPARRQPAAAKPPAGTAPPAEGVGSHG